MKWRIKMGIVSLIFFGGIIAFALTRGFSFTGGGATAFDSQFEKWARINGVSVELLRAIARVESSMNSRAIGDNGDSIGLMQINCRPDSSGVCTARFPGVPIWPGATRNKLLGAEFNIAVASYILRENIDRYGFVKGVAVYNRYASRNENPPFTNQGYVNKVMLALGGIPDDVQEMEQ